MSMVICLKLAFTACPTIERERSEGASICLKLAFTACPTQSASSPSLP